MNKKVLVITTSFRNKSNSEKLADYFIKGAKESENQVEKIELRSKEIHFCRGCLACQKIGKCVIKDDANEIIEKMRNAEVIVFATPIYYYEMSGQMKTLLDRTNPLFGSEYSFREIYLLTVAADNSENTDAGAIKGLNGWISCFDKARLVKTLFAGGVEKANEIEGNPKLEAAYKMGKQV